VKRLAAAGLALVLLVLAAGCGGGDEATPAVPKFRSIGVSRSFEPKAAFWGEPVTARVEMVVDRRKLDPDRIRLEPKTFPYRRFTPLVRHRSDSGNFTKLEYEVGMRCLYYACLPVRIDYPGIIPYRDQRVTRFQPWHVFYDDPKTKKPRHLARVFWPSLERVSNLDLTDAQVTFQQLPGRLNLNLQPDVSYRLPVPLLAALILLLAAALLVFPAWLLIRWLRSRRPPPPPPDPPLPPLERALLLVEWSRDRVDGEDRREALEELAFRLDEAGKPALARSARRLAWSSPSPSPAAADELVEEVRNDR
jgi:hypothetical protein